MKSKLLFILFSILLPFKTSAYYDTTTIDGIKYGYNTEGSNATVMSITCGGIVEIPTTIKTNGKEYNVTRIYYQAAANNSGLIAIKMPNTIIEIGYQAFAGCTNLSALELPDIVKLDGATFWGCSSLKSIALHSGVVFDTGTYSGADFARCTGLKSATVDCEVIPNQLFDGCTSLEIIELNNKIKTIGKSAFKDCGIKSIVLPIEIETIDYELFSGCKNLSAIEIPSGVTSINMWAFRDCSSLTSVIIPDNVRRIGMDAFNGCSSLTSVTLGKGLNDINNNAFKGCNLKTVIFHCSSIDSWFQSSETIKEVIMGKEVRTVCEAAFYGCKELNSITMQENVDSIGKQAFMLCTSLESIYIPDNVSYIGNYAFSNCTALASINIPRHMSRIENNTFSWCKGLTTVVIPENIISIGSHAFEYCTGLTSFTIPSSVERLGDCFLFECTNIDSITSFIHDPYEINSNVFWVTHPHFTSATLYVPVGTKEKYESTPAWNMFKKIVELADDSNTDNVSFSDNRVKEICLKNWDANGDGELSKQEAAAVTDLGLVFMENEEITSFDELQYFTGLTSIPNNTFRGCSKLKSIVIPVNVSDLGTFHPFFFCSSLSNVIVAEGNSTYDSRDNCNGIIETATNKLVLGTPNMTIPSTVTNIGTAAFANYTSMTSMTIPNSVKTLSRQAFVGCEGLTSIFIPASVANMATDVFLGCSGLTSMSVASENTTFDSRENCNAIIYTPTNTLVAGCKTTVIPSSVKRIGEAAFAVQKTLEKIDLPENLISIGENAFWQCTQLSTINIPSTVTSIEEYAFEECNNLANVYSYISTPFDINENVFTTYETTTLYVPAGTKAKYQVAAGWKKFANIKEMELNDGDIFGADINGTWMTFRVLSAKDKTAQVGTSDQLYSFSGYDTAVNWETANGVIVIPSRINGYTVTSIASGAFLKCSSISEVVIPSTITTIGSNAFMSSGVSKVSIPESVSTIGSSVFYGCSNLVRFRWPANLPVIPDQAFNSCKNLTEVTIPEGVTDIGGKAFNDCALRLVILPSTLKSISSFAFQGCYDMDVYCKVERPFKLDKFAFATGYYIEQNTKIYDYDGRLYVPAGCKNLYQNTDTWNWFHEITETDYKSGNVQTKNWYAVYSDGTLSLYFDEKMASRNGVIYSNQWRMDEEEAWGEYRRSIEKVYIDKSFADFAPSMTRCMFMNCTSLKSIEGLENLNTSKVSNMSHMFNGCSSLTTLDLSAFDTPYVSQMSNMFANCSSLKTIYVSEKWNLDFLTNGNSMFYKCEKLTGEKGTKYDESFYRKTYDDYVFAHIDEGKDNPGYFTYKRTSDNPASTETFKVDGADYSFEANTEDPDLGVTIIDDEDIEGEFEIPLVVEHNGISHIVTGIGDGAFKDNTLLTQITIPGTINSIGDEAFAGCKNLLVIIIYVINPVDLSNVRTRAENSSVFEGVDMEKCVLYVPDGSVDAYRTAEVWKEFKQILPISTLGISNIGLDNKTFDVYNLQGRIIRHHATSLNHLPKGVYIINGKKIVK